MARANVDFPLAVGPTTTMIASWIPPPAAGVAAGAASLFSTEADRPMRHVLTLITDPAGPGLDDSMVSVAGSALEAANAAPGAVDWLAPGIACDIPFAAGDLDKIRATMRAALAGMPVDVVAQPVKGRRKSLLAADLEATIIENEMLVELASAANVEEEITHITAQAMTGELDFAAAFRARVALLKGLRADLLDASCAHIVFTPGAAELVGTMRAMGACTALVSGGFQIFASHARAVLGFDEDIANEPEIVDGRLTGRVREPIIDRDGKLAVVARIAAERGIPLDRVISVGDGANDVRMLAETGCGVAYHAKPAVARATPVRIDHGDLTALLYIQGYRKDGFVTAKPA